jgi:hypothetical protein
MVPFGLNTQGGRERRRLHFPRAVNATRLLFPGSANLRNVPWAKSLFRYLISM